MLTLPHLEDVQNEVAYEYDDGNDDQDDNDERHYAAGAAGLLRLSIAPRILLISQQPVVHAIPARNATSSTKHTSVNVIGSMYTG